LRELTNLSAADRCHPKELGSDLSSRPERSGVEGSAVRLSFVTTQERFPLS
jgi:hypothetical protein